MSSARCSKTILILTAILTVATSVPAEGYPTGLVLDELEVDLGSGRPADLFLNGEKACSMTTEQTWCTVDLGADTHAHLLELAVQ